MAKREASDKAAFLDALEDETSDLATALQLIPETLAQGEFDEVESVIETMETLATNLRTYMNDRKKDE